MPKHHCNYLTSIRFSVLILAILLVGSYRPACAQAIHTTALQGVNVTLSLSSTRISVGQPNTFAITLDNQSPMATVDVTASYQLAEGNDIDLRVQPPGELPYRYEGALNSGSYTRVPIRLTRGLPRKIEQMLLYDRTQPTGFLFSKPGKYIVQGTVRLSLFNNPNMDEALLPATEIVVEPAEGPDADAFAAVDEPDLAKALHLGIAQTTAIAETLEPIAAKHTATVLGALALRSVGQFYAHADTTNRDRGAAMLTDYLETGLAPMDADYTAWSIAAAYHLSAKYDLAREWIFYTLRHFPNSFRLRPEDALFKFYVFDPATFAAQVPWYLLETPWQIPNAKPSTDLRPTQEAE